MTKIARFKTLDNGEDFINILNNKELLIYEDIQGAKIFAQYDGNQFIIKPKNLKTENLNIIDLSMQKFYNQVYVYLNTLPDYITELLNKKWWFVFEYFPDSMPANIKYNRVPKNNLILTSIIKKKNFIYNYNEILEYSKLFDVDPLPILFKGKLNNKQLEVIELYLNTNENDLIYIFNEDNFAKFFYSILNPNTTNSFLMDDFNENLEKIVIKIDNNEKYTFEILNPLYTKLEFHNNSEYTEIYSIILVKFLEFVQTIDITKIKIKKITREEIYIELLSEIFNKFISTNYDNLIEWEFIIPTFFKEEKFKINIDLLNNDKTIEYIKSNEKIEYIFKCILGSFQKKKKKTIGVFTDITLKLFNNFVLEISNLIDKTLKINMEYQLQKSDLINFKDYFNIKYETDAGDDWYPDVYDEFYDEEGGDKKGKKKKKMVKKKGFDQWDEEDFDDFNIKDEKL